MPDLRFRRFRFHRTVEDREGPVGVPGASSQPSLWPERGIAEFLRCRGTVDGRHGLSQLGLCLCVKAEFGQEVEPRIPRKPEYSAAASAGGDLIEQRLRTGNFVHVHSDQKQIFH